jgi:hypothetical protein
MIHRYAEWTRKRASTAQCSPALAALGCVVVFAIVVYVYRQVIMTTIIDAVLAAVGVALFTGAVAVTISTIRWYRRKAAQEASAKPAEDIHWPMPTDDAGVAAIHDEAEWLASGVELAFSPDGKSLVSRDKK